MQAEYDVSGLPAPDSEFFAQQNLLRHEFCYHSSPLPKIIFASANSDLPLLLLYHKQKCLLARAFLRRSSMTQLREAQKGVAQRLPQEGFLRILYHIRAVFLPQNAHFAHHSRLSTAAFTVCSWRKRQTVRQPPEIEVNHKKATGKPIALFGAGKAFGKPKGD